MLRSRRMTATRRMIASEYIPIRWNQHSVHGTKCATSEKYRLPSIAVAATEKASGTPNRASSTRRSSRSAAAPFDQWEASQRPTPARTAAFATSVSRAKKSSAVSGVIISGGGEEGNEPILLAKEVL